MAASAKPAVVLAGRPTAEWASNARARQRSPSRIRGGLMTNSYTQISHYLTSPRRYRHRYLDGWQEKDTRAALMFGRAFERALAAYFLREDAAAALFREWTACQKQGLRYSNGDTWDRMLQQGIQLLDRFCQDDRIRIRQRRRKLQIKFTRRVSKQNDFVAYVDAIGRLDDRRCLLEWKTTSSRYSEELEGLLALDPQLVCYSWITGIAEVAQWSSSASGWLRCNTYGRRLPTSNGRNLANWSKTPSGGSSLPSSCLIAGFASRRTLAAAAPTSGFVWDGMSWSRPLWCGGQEPK